MQTPTEQINTNWIKMRDIIRFTEYMLSFISFLSGILPKSEHLHYGLTLDLYEYLRSHVYSSCNEPFDQKNLKNYFINNYKQILNYLNIYSDNFKNDLKQYHLDNLIDYDKIKEETTKEQKEKILELMFFYLWEKLEFFKINAEKFIKYLLHVDFFSDQGSTFINLHIENNWKLYRADLGREYSTKFGYDKDELFNTTRIYSCYMTAMYFYPEYFTSQIAPDKDKIMFCLTMDSIFDEKQLDIIRPLININVESNEYNNLPENVQNIIKQLESEKLRNDLINYWNSLEDVNPNQAKTTKDGKTIMNASVFSFNVHSENSNDIQSNLKANIQSGKNEYENYKFEKQIFVFNGQNQELYEYIEALKKKINSLNLLELQNSGINIIDEITTEAKESFKNEFQQLSEEFNNDNDNNPESHRRKLSDYEEKYIPFENWYDEHKIEKIRTITKGEIINFLEKPENGQMFFLQKLFINKLKFSFNVDNDRIFFCSAIKISISNLYKNNDFNNLIESVIPYFIDSKLLSATEKDEILKGLPPELQFSLITKYLYNPNSEASKILLGARLRDGELNQYFNANNHFYEICFEVTKQFVMNLNSNKEIERETLCNIFNNYRHLHSLNRLNHGTKEKLLEKLSLEKQICALTNGVYFDYTEPKNNYIKKVCNNEFPNCQHPEILISATVKKLHEKYPEKKQNRIAFKIIFEDEKFEQENKKEFVQQYFSNPEEIEKFVKDNSFIKKVSRGQFPFDKGTAMLILYKFYYLYKENSNKATFIKLKITKNKKTQEAVKKFLLTTDIIEIIETCNAISNLSLSQEDKNLRIQKFIFNISETIYHNINVPINIQQQETR